MRRIAVAALVLTLAGLGAVLNPSKAWACSCAFPAEHPDNVRRADVIFTGTITGDTALGNTRYLRFAVDRVYKGQAFADQQVVTHVSPATCGLEISGPGVFIVQAQLERRDPDHPGAGELRADLCGGTRPGSAPAGLGDGQPPIGPTGPATPTPAATLTTPPGPTVSDPGPPLWRMLAIGFSVGGLLIGALGLAVLLAVVPGRSRRGS